MSLFRTCICNDFMRFAMFALAGVILCRALHRFLVGILGVHLRHSVYVQPRYVWLRPSIQEYPLFS